MEEIEKSKKIIRKEYILKRNKIQNKDKKSQKIINKILDCDFYKQAQIIALYKSLPSEVNTNELISYSIDLGKIVTLPRMDNGNLKFYKMNTINDKLVKSEFGVEEPIELEINFIEKEKIDLMIVPGVCFDKEKNRMGFGKGCYDKYLENTNIKTIGICFDEQIVDKLPTTPNDIEMYKVITDKNIY